MSDLEYALREVFGFCEKGVGYLASADKNSKEEGKELVFMVDSLAMMFHAKECEKCQRAAKVFTMWQEAQREKEEATPTE